MPPRLLLAGELRAPRAARSLVERCRAAPAHARPRPRQVVEMALDRAQLEGEGARVAVVEHDEVEHRRGLELAEIAPAIGDGAVAEFERDAAWRRPSRSATGRTARARERSTNCARSMRRPRSRNSQPVPRVMFSWARPDRVATKRTMSSSAASSGSRLPRAAEQALAHVDHQRAGGR